MTDIATTPVLLVDDRPENLTALEGLLEDMGLALFKATSGNEALRLTLKHDFALVLMDVRMPDMDGYETAELMRANPRTSRLPIIFVTAAMKDTEHQFKGYEAGAFDYLMKPIEPTILRSKVRVFCDLYQQRLQIEQHEQQLETIVSERTEELNATLVSLRESERRFRDLLASVTSYMYTVVMEDNRAVATTHGPGCLAVTGFSAEDYAADPDLWHRMIHPEDRQFVLDAAQDILNAKSTHTFEHRIQHKDGSIRWVQTTLVPHCSPLGQLLSYDGVITEITGRKRSEEALQQNEEKYHTLFEECFDCLFVTSPAGKILDMNKKGIVMFGYDTKEEVLCLDLERNVYLHSQDRERILVIVNERGSVEYEVIVKKKNGEQMLTYCTLTAVRDETGMITSYRGIMRDLTDRERAEVEIRKLNEELEQRVRERTRELERRNYELEQMNKAFVGRELRMVELKERIAELKNEVNQGT